MENNKIEENKLIIMESEKNDVRKKEVDKLLKKFQEDLMPLGVTCKNWAKFE